MLIAKFDSDGTKDLVKLIGSTSWESAFAVKNITSGCLPPEPYGTLDEQAEECTNVCVAGWTFGEFDGQTNAGGEDTCLIKLNAEGTNQFTRIWGSWKTDEGHDMDVDRNGNAYVVGSTTGEFDGQTNTGGQDIFLTWFNADGTKRGSHIWGSATHDVAYGVAVDGNGSVYVVGDTIGSFDGQTNVGSHDVFITKFINVAPIIDITNMPFMVEPPDTTASIAGTNNEHVAVNSGMWWLNTVTNGLEGTFLASTSRTWKIQGIPLIEGTNIITVSGSNLYGHVGTDSIVIELVPEVLIGLPLAAALFLVSAIRRRRH